MKPERIQRNAGLFEQAPTLASKVMKVVDWILAVAEVLKGLFGKPTSGNDNR